MTVNDKEKVRAALSLLPAIGLPVKLTLDNSKSVLKKGPHAATCPDTYELVGRVNAKPGWDRNPENFAIIVPYSPVQLRIISIFNVLAINDVPTDITPTKNRVTVQLFIVEGSKGNSYHVRFDGEQWSCDCPAYHFRRNCRHITQSREAHAKNHKS